MQVCMKIASIAEKMNSACKRVMYVYFSCKNPNLYTPWSHKEIIFIVYSYIFKIDNVNIH